MARLLSPGHNCEQIAPVTATGLLIDSRNYFLAVHAAIARAERFVLILGWQFHTRAELLCGEDCGGAEAPVTLLPLLQHVERTRPELRIYLLAWDPSVVYTLEREWMQQIKFDWATSERIRFVFDAQHAPRASHHQKLVVVDGAIAFMGGIDLSASRWDDRPHAPDSPERVNEKGERRKPYHDLMTYCVGPAVDELMRLFVLRWQRATGETLELAKDGIAPAPVPKQGLPLPFDEVGISLTFGEHAASETPLVEQIKQLYEDAIAASERLIYIEVQYFTSRAIVAALRARLSATDRARIQLVMMMPIKGDTPKETFAFGDAQARALAAVAASAREHGHELRMLTSVAKDAQGEDVQTFIHSKLMIVDDRLLTVGSANCTNRSMSYDTELNMVWESTDSDPRLSQAIARVRADLLCEHAGVAYDPSLEAIDGLVERLDRLIGHSKLRLRGEPEVPSGKPQWLFDLAFDPGATEAEIELEEADARYRT